MTNIKRLNIFVDETGEFGFFDGASDIYGISFTFHESVNDIISQLEVFNKRLEKNGYTDMIHMADLIMHRGDYAKFDIKMRKSIFNAIYQFARKVPVNYYTIIIDKKYTDNGNVLRRKIISDVNQMIKKYEEYFNKFDRLVLYYDNGQEPLGYILDSLFIRFDNFQHRVDFDHKEKRLFQVSDMLTYVDKFDYKYKHKLKFAKGEKYFFDLMEIRKVLKELEKKRF